MTNDKDRTKEWRELCKAAANEMDPEKLQDLIVEINKALDERAQKRTADVDENPEAGALRDTYGVT
jgi:hypothetical protein